MLLGMPGSGKTTLGRELAQHYGYPFLDLDAAIETSAGRSIPAIFETQGQAYFREVEARTLREVLRRPGPLVLATGGGTPCFHDNMACLQAAGLTLWLDVPLPELAARLRAAGLRSRPLVAATAQAATTDSVALETWLHETLKVRRGFYALASHRLPPTPDPLAAALALLATPDSENSPEAAP